MQPLIDPQKMTTTAALVGSREPCMMASMSDWNFMTVIILIGIFVLWKLEFAATLLNLRAFPGSVPKVLGDLMDSEKLEKQDEKAWAMLKDADGILVPGGFGKRGIEGKVAAARHAI
jgi:CTP synthase (UTP-ammonia lyase)